MSEVSLSEERSLVELRLRELTAMHRRGATARELRGAQYDAGLAWVWFPPGFGGLGASAALQDFVDDALNDAGVSPLNDMSGTAVAMSAPTLVAYGTVTQRQLHLRRIFTGEEIWCQLFSEPGAGSDLASVATRAQRDGDDWVVNGVKVWTSFAHLADYALLLARHDPELPKRAGLTYFIVDMRSVGVEIRSLREMTGEAQFSEVVLTDVRIPDAQRVGGVGEGWRAALATLASERLGRGDPLGAGAIDAALAIWREHPLTNAVHRDRLVELWVASEALRLLGLRGAEKGLSGTPGPEGSLIKLGSAELGQRIYSFCLTLLGANGMLLPGGYEPTGFTPGEHVAERAVQWMAMRARGFTIEGGTAQIQRNVIAERILGLPNDRQDDRELPWSQIRRA